MQHLHGAVFHLVPDDTEILEIAHHVGGVLGQHAHQFGHVLEMSSADGVEVVAGWRIGARNGGLHAALGHHGVGVAHAQLGGDQRLDAIARRGDRGPAASAAAADDEKIGFVVGLRQMDVHQLGLDHRMSFQDLGHLAGELLAAVGADADGALGARCEIRMVLGQHILPLSGVHRRINGLTAQG